MGWPRIGSESVFFAGLPNACRVSYGAANNFSTTGNDAAAKNGSQLIDRLALSRAKALRKKRKQQTLCGVST
jgi:hypothetical protein